MFDIGVEVVQEREREVEQTVSIYKPHHFLNKEYTNKKINLCNKMKKKLYGHTNNNYLDEDVPIMCFDPRKITFFVMIFFKFAQNLVGNLIFCITFLTTLLCCSINIHGIEFILTCSMVAMKLNYVFHCMASFLNVFARFHNFVFLPP